LISIRDFREALWLELMSANSPADLPLRGNVVASPSEGSSRGFQIGEPASIAIDYSRSICRESNLENFQEVIKSRGSRLDLISRKVKVGIAVISVTVTAVETSSSVTNDRLVVIQVSMI